VTARGRLGLIAHYSTVNYGNHLVNLAARRVLERCGYEVDLLVFESGGSRRRMDALRRLPAKLARLLRDGMLLDRLAGRARRAVAPARRRPGAVDAARRDAFRRFADTHLRPTFRDPARRWSLTATYTRFAIGSDQIWNYDYGLGPWHFADFAAPGHTVCLAPSVGHDIIPDEWVPAYQGWLSRFDEVGVRELLWTESLPEWPERPAFELLIDPTLALPAEEWREIARVPDSGSPALLVYELGDFSPTQRSAIRDIARTHGLDTQRLSARIGGPLWATDAADFLGMIAASAAVVTDSYHGAIFAFLFDKPLVLIRREGFAGAMNSRVETLARELQLTDRFLDTLPVEDAVTHDYTAGRRALADRRDAFWAYLARHDLVPDERRAPHDRGGHRHP